MGGTLPDPTVGDMELDNAEEWMASVERNLERIATAAERIAAVLERAGPMPRLPEVLR
jgi:hypothetical protein